MKIKIEKGVPINAKEEVKSKYPFQDMEVGDSFFIKCDSETMQSKRASALSSSIYYGKITGKKFKSKIYEDGFRMWRVS